MANVYLGSELLNGGGSSSSSQAGASAISSLSIWSGTYQEYSAISTPDTSTIYFVKGKPSSIVPSGTTFTKSQSATGNVAEGTSVTFSVDLSSIIDPDMQPGSLGFKWWISDATSNATVSAFTESGVGTSLATASIIPNDTITLTTNTSQNGLYRVNVAIFDGTTQS